MSAVGLNISYPADRCPACGSGRLNYGWQEIWDFGNKFYWEFECLDCRKVFSANYSIELLEVIETNIPGIPQGRETNADK